MEDIDIFSMTSRYLNWLALSGDVAVGMYDCVKVYPFQAFKFHASDRLAYCTLGD